MAEDAEGRTTREEDDRVEAAVLAHLLDLHPTLLTAEEVVREIAGEEADFAARDAVERALRDLTAAGLLHREHGMVAPTRAALRFNELADL